VVAWVLVPPLNAVINLLLGAEVRSAIWDQDEPVIALNYAALSLAVLISLWGSRRIARRLEGLSAETGALVPARATEYFADRLRIAIVPLAAAAATALAFGLSSLRDDGLVAAVVRTVTWLAVGVAICTFLWTYASLQLGLHRLGKDPLPAEPTVDPGLGLLPLGRIASMGLWMLLLALVPVLLTGLPDIVGVGIGLLVLTAGLAAFFLPLLRLHRQMQEAKKQALEIARGLYDEAYAPIRSDPILETLERQQSLLSAAEALEKRALAIHEWPVDEGTVARVITIATSVVAMATARLILDPFGL
jgi:hypothetical protein